MAFITAAEAARLKGVHPSTVSRWIRSGLRHRRYGSAVLIDREHLDAFEPAPVGNPGFVRRALEAKPRGTNMASFREFLSSGAIGEIKLGMLPEAVERLWGPPDDRSVQTRATEHFRYGSVELIFQSVPDTADARLAAVAIDFGKPDQQLPPGARFDDWSPTNATTEAEFQAFIAAAGLSAHSRLEGEYARLVLGSGASAVFEDGRLHSVRYRRADKSPRPKQMSVSLPESTLTHLRARAERENISLQELIQRVLSTTR